MDVLKADCIYMAVCFFYGVCRHINSCGNTSCFRDCKFFCKIYWFNFAGKQSICRGVHPMSPQDIHSGLVLSIHALGRDNIATRISYCRSIHNDQEY